MIPGEMLVEPGELVLNEGRATLTLVVSPLLVAALLVLLWELVALARQWFRLNEYAGADSH